MPTTSAGSRGTDPFEQARHAGRELTRLTGVARHDVLVVLGTGLGRVATLLGAEGQPIDLTALPWFARFTGVGHRPEAWSIPIGGVQALVMAGRLHLYEGLTPVEVVHPVRTALATGCRTVILTCSAGAISPDLSVGDVVLIGDHLNLTATSPLSGVPAEHAAGTPFVDLGDVWSPRLRGLAREADPRLSEQVYAHVLGPNLETPAEIRMLAAAGADLVGMSTVPEAIASRHLGAEVLGMAVVTNPAAGTSAQSFSLNDVADAAAGAAERVARIVRSVVEQLDPVDAPGARP
ncbi:MAG TPA: purine-nucleoside phosphorylase [Acidimicrobiales bacterium]|nr:purine-nucleoside phosphorylase [Acidimicrobiales bacterium]